VVLPVLEARRREKFFRGEVTGAIQGDQVAAFHEDELFQDLASLGLCEAAFESRPQTIGMHNIESRAHLGVTWNPLHSVNGLEIVFLCLSSPIESQQARVFEGKHGETGHQDITKTNLRESSGGFLHFAEPPAHFSIQSIRIQMLTWFEARGCGLARISHGMIP
jgi:hypothetical protein